MTAVAEGTAEIIVVTSRGKTAICTVTVTKAVEEPTPNDPNQGGGAPIEPAPNPVPSTPDSDASTGASNEATDGDVPSGATTTEEDGGNNLGTFVVVGIVIAVIVALVAIFFTMKCKKDK